MKIGFLVIATNKYIKFVKPLTDSINKYLFQNHEKTIFCFTDDVSFVYDNVVNIYQEHMQWPLPTLMRYEIIYKNREKYNNIDVLYYIDADMLIHGNIGDELLPNNNELVAVEHPGYFRDKIQCFETNVNSTAYLEREKYGMYYCGGVQGGSSETYLTVCKQLMDNINIDKNNNIIAVWHDESHWNCYLNNNKGKFKTMTSTFCYPESWNLNIPKRIIALDKNHTEMRN